MRPPVSPVKEGRDGEMEGWREDVDEKVEGHTLLVMTSVKRSNNYKNKGMGKRREGEADERRMSVGS